MSNNSPLIVVQESLACSEIVEKSKSRKKNIIKCTYSGCDLTFSRQWKRDRHYYTHTGERPFRCVKDGCSKTYQCNTHLQRHIRVSHMKAEVILPCTYPSCKATFRHKSALVKHCKNHGKPRSFQCSVCSVSFLTKQRLAHHEMAHSGVLPYSCAVCESAWASQTLLRRHMRSHALLQCEYPGCSEVCASRSVMRKHEKLQHRVVLKCEHCNKTFRNKGMLREHVLVHLPADQRGIFCCPHPPCMRGYFQMRNLRHHIKVFHSQKRYYCSAKDCLSSSVSEVKLQRHMFRKHRLLMNEEERKEDLIKGLVSIIPAIDEDASETKSESAKPGQTVMVVMMRDHINL